MVRTPLRGDQRGATRVEYILAVGGIALVAIAGARLHGSKIEAKAHEQALCAASLDCADAGDGLRPTAARGVQSSSSTAVSSSGSVTSASDTEYYRGVPITGAAAARRQKKAEFAQRIRRVRRAVD